MKQLRLTAIQAVTAALMSLAITGCATTTRAIQYKCERGTNLSAKFSTDGKLVEIAIQDGAQLTLPAMPVGSGFMYGNGSYELRGKGKAAVWSVGRMATEHCIALP